MQNTKKQYTKKCTKYKHQHIPTSPNTTHTYIRNLWLQWSFSGWQLEVVFLGFAVFALLAFLLLFLMTFLMLLIFLLCTCTCTVTRTMDCIGPQWVVQVLLTRLHRIQSRVLGFAGLQ